MIRQLARVVDQAIAAGSSAQRRKVLTEIAVRSIELIVDSLLDEIEPAQARELLSFAAIYERIGVKIRERAISDTIAVEIAERKPLRRGGRS